jgi:hypothetical protein
LWYRYIPTPLILTVTDAWRSCNSNTITDRVQETGWRGTRIHEAPECTTSSTGTGATVVHIHMGTTAHTWWVMFFLAEKTIDLFFKLKNGSVIIKIIQILLIIWTEFHNSATGRLMPVCTPVAKYYFISCCNHVKCEHIQDFVTLEY